MSAVRQRIALIHAVRVAMQPVEDAFAEHWPEAERINLLDDSLSPDRECDGELTEAMAQHMIGCSLPPHENWMAAMP